MSFVFGGVVGLPVADPVVLGEGAVQERVVGVRLTQHLQQARRLVRQVPDDCRDVGVGGADRYAEARGELREGVVPPEVDQGDESTLVRRELAAPVTLTGDDEHGYPLDHSVRQVECGRIWDQRGSRAAELRRQTPLSTEGASCVAGADLVTHPVAALKELNDCSSILQLLHPGVRYFDLDDSPRRPRSKREVFRVYRVSREEEAAGAVSVVCRGFGGVQSVVQDTHQGLHIRSVRGASGGCLGLDLFGVVPLCLWSRETGVRWVGGPGWL